MRRRHVVYVPGYDPGASRRYRGLFVRELGRWAERFDVVRQAVTPPTTAPDGLSQAWSVEVETPHWSTSTLYEVLLWDDIVAADVRRPLAVRAALVVRATLHSLASGALVRIYRLSPHYGQVVAYSILVTLLLGLLMAGVGWGVDAVLAGPGGVPEPGPAVAGLAAAGLALLLSAPLFDRLFAWQLLHHWVFDWEHGNGRRPDYEKRLDAFARFLVARARAEDGAAADELLLVGHSTGAPAAVEILARARALDQALGAVSLATIGSGLPLVAVQPRAGARLAEIGALVADAATVWVDYQAPQDWMNFPGFQPVRDLGLAVAPVLNPFVRSARFRDVLDPASYAAILGRPYRLHFQFLMANDRPGAYDFFAMTLGPQRLLDRVSEPLLMPPRRGAP